MAVRLNPYLSFRGDARAALEFYRDVFGGELEISTFEGFGDMPGLTEEEKTNVMHGMLVTPNGLTIMAADTPSAMPYNPGDTITVSVSGDELEVLTGYWNALSDGGAVAAPFERAPWGDTFGMCTDRFGVPWMINATS